ncbi:MAG: hypothetical protein BWY99_02285 [Synergistetes bacterium ADurb.BinA166]|nr:MAG: hypothetical protein BWY99_02285 [Synergistetes bacterium ADurb.BinA166]
MRFSPPDRLSGLLARYESSSPTMDRAAEASGAILSDCTPQFVGAKESSSMTSSANSCCSGYWNTRPTALRMSRIFGLFSTTCIPSTDTVPESGNRMPLRCWASVDLPLPVCPTIESHSPLPHWSDTSSRARVSSGVPGW